MALPIGLDAMLGDPQAFQDLVGQLQASIPQRLIDFCNSTDRRDFQKVLAILLSAEPLVILSLRSHLSLNHTLGQESVDQYFTWRANTDPEGGLSAVGVTVDLLKTWHAKLALAAHFNDPLERWRTLVRYAPREQRLRFQKNALLAEELYYAAEVLRRYLEHYHGADDLLEEDDVAYGQQGPAVKQRMYGKRRTTEFDRSVFRHVVRQFDLDPQPRLRWLVEGSTEVGFIEEYAKRLHLNLDNSGIEVINLQGLGSLEGERTRTLLRISRQEEIFAYVSIDHDGLDKNPKILSHYAEQGLLIAGFHIHQPNFEEANFTLEELAMAASNYASSPEFSCHITAEDIQLRMSETGFAAAKAIEGIWQSRTFTEGKGTDWGRCLAEVAFDYEAPAGIPNQDGVRSVVHIFELLQRARSSNYKFTVENTFVDGEGKVVNK